MSLKNWDNDTWLSSNEYIKKFNNFLLKQKKLNKDSLILDIGCGRGKILGELNSRLRLKNKPTGLDILSHNDRDKRINFKRIDVLKFLKKDKKNYDLILIKQTIHLLNFKKIKKLILTCKTKLNHKGKIIIFSLETSKNEIPTFFLMKKKLENSFKRDKKIIRFLYKLYPRTKRKIFSFRVKITKNKYLEMIKNRYISTLLNFKSNEISKGIDEINQKFKKTLSFNDKLICLILEK